MTLILFFAIAVAVFVTMFFQFEQCTEFGGTTALKSYRPSEIFFPKINLMKI
jgi:hypothetical protein